MHETFISCPGFVTYDGQSFITVPDIPTALTDFSRNVDIGNALSYEEITAWSSTITSEDPELTVGVLDLLEFVTSIPCTLPAETRTTHYPPHITFTRIPLASSANGPNNPTNADMDYDMPMEQPTTRPTSTSVRRKKAKSIAQAILYKPQLSRTVPT